MQKAILITPLSQLKQQRQSTLSVIQKIRMVSDKLNYKGMQRINSTALFQIHAKHTNQFTIQIGAGYFVQLTAQNAIKLLERRLKNIEQLTKKYQTHQQEQKKETTYGKAKTVTIQRQGNKKSYMEVIGQENGEDIFNIVEIEEPNQNQLSPQPIQNKPKSIANKVVQQNSQATQNQKDVGNLAPVQQPENQQQNQQQDGEQSKGSEESENEYGDLIHYHRKHILGVPSQVSASTPSIPKPQKQAGIISMQQIDPAVPQKKKNKQKKRVSFADQLITKVEQSKQQQAETKSKEKKKQDKKQVKEQVQNIQKTLNGKVSRFKLERMKARMQKQDK